MVIRNKRHMGHIADKTKHLLTPKKQPGLSKAMVEHVKAT